MAIITIPKILHEKLSEEGVNALIDILDKVEVQSHAHTLEITEERFEKRLVTEATQIRADLKVMEQHFEKRLVTETTQIRADLKVMEQHFEKRLVTETTQIRADLKVMEQHFEKRIAETKTDLIKWMFIFWIGQFASIVGVLTAILFAFFKR